jgi:hypothetical protein
VLAAVIALGLWWPFGSSGADPATRRPGAASSSAPGGASGSEGGSGAPAGEQGGATAAPSEAAPTYVNAAPGESPPVRPPDEMTDAGAEAFVRYWVQASDWAWATMDPTLVRAATQEGCELCTMTVERINKDRAAGIRYEGGRYSLQKLVVMPIGAVPYPAPQDGSQRAVSVWVNATEWTVYGPDGSVQIHDDPEVMSEYSLTIQHSSLGWSVSAFYIIKHIGS